MNAKQILKMAELLQIDMADVNSSNGITAPTFSNVCRKQADIKVNKNPFVCPDCEEVIVERSGRRLVKMVFIVKVNVPCGCTAGVLGCPRNLSSLSVSVLIYFSPLENAQCLR